MPVPIRTSLAVLAVVFTPMAALADVTALAGVMTVDGARPAFVFSFTYCPSYAGFEMELTGTTRGGGATHTVGGFFLNAFAQTGEVMPRTEFYGTGGLGLYGETAPGGSGSGEVTAKDLGGGAKIWLAERLRLRLDYRIFLLGDAPDASRGFVVHRSPQRLSAGLTVVF